MAFERQYLTDNYAYIDLSELHKRIMLSRLQSAGSISINEHVMPCRDKFLVMSTRTLEVINKSNEVIKSSYGSEPDAYFLFGVRIAICDALDFGFIKIVNGEY